MKSNVEWLQVKSYMPSACFGIRKWHIKTLDTCHDAKRYGGFHCALNLVIFLKFTGPQWVKQGRGFRMGYAFNFQFLLLVRA